jgi:hypothetical protein
MTVAQTNPVCAYQLAGMIARVTDFPESNTTCDSIIIGGGKICMKRITIVFLGTCVVLATGCDLIGIQGNRHIKTDERSVSPFANIDVRGAFTIEWQNGTPGLRITTDENLLPYIDSNVSGDTLHLRTREQIRPTHGVKVFISGPTRTGVRISGAVKLVAKQLTGPRFALEARGASQVSLDGNIDELLADMTGASELAADSLQTKTAEISTTGAGDAEIAVTQTLKVVITGAGKVKYSGNPGTVEKHISGAGSIRKKD